MTGLNNSIAHSPSPVPPSLYPRNALGAEDMLEGRTVPPQTFQLHSGNIFSWQHESSHP